MKLLGYRIIKESKYQQKLCEAFDSGAHERARVEHLERMNANKCDRTFETDSGCYQIKVIKVL